MSDAPAIALLVYQGLVLAILGALGGVLLINLAVLPRLRAFPPAGRDAGARDAPFVSVLVPARDEAGNIEACLRGLLASTYPAFEVLVLDDDSRDATAAIVARLAAGDQRLRLLAGGILPPGWLGKPNACRQLADHARGDLLLFTDADVRHAPALLGHAVAAAGALDIDLLSVFPVQVTDTWAERLVVPLMQHFAVYVLLPLPLLRRHRSPAFAAANGEFLLFRRAAYYACGGHAAVRGAVLDDVGLARALKAAGYRVALADGGDLVTCRMYHSAAEVWAGFSKNLFAFFDDSRLFLTCGLLGAALLWVLPAVDFGCWMLDVGCWTLRGSPGNSCILSGVGTAFGSLALAQYAAAVLTRALLAWRFHGRVGDAFFHPLGVAYLIAIGVNSARLARRGGVVWKGRAVGSTRQ